MYFQYELGLIKIKLINKNKINLQSRTLYCCYPDQHKLHALGSFDQPPFAKNRVRGYAHGYWFEVWDFWLTTTALLAAAPDLMYSTSKLTIWSLFLDSSESHSIPLWVVDIDLNCWCIFPFDRHFSVSLENYTVTVVIKNNFYQGLHISSLLFDLPTT